MRDGVPARQWNRAGKLHRCPPLPDPDKHEADDTLRCNECGAVVVLVDITRPSMATGKPEGKRWFPQDAL